MRRKDREMSREFALSIIDKCIYAVLATVDADGAPYCVPVTIVRDGEHIYFHCALAGKKADNMRREPRVCMTCVGNVHVPPHRFTTEYESAVLTGTAEEVTAPAEKTRALRLLCLRHTPDHMDAFDEAIERSLSITAVWRIAMEQLTGKRKKYDAHGTEMKFGRME